MARRRLVTGLTATAVGLLWPPFPVLTGTGRASVRAALAYAVLALLAVHLSRDTEGGLASGRPAWRSPLGAVLAALAVLVAAGVGIVVEPVLPVVALAILGLVALAAAVLWLLLQATDAGVVPAPFVWLLPFALLVDTLLAFTLFPVPRWVSLFGLTWLGLAVVVALDLDAANEADGSGRAAE